MPINYQKEFRALMQATRPTVLCGRRDARPAGGGGRCGRLTENNTPPDRGGGEKGAHLPHWTPGVARALLPTTSADLIPN